MFREKFMDKCIVLILALTASLPLMVNYNIVGEELLWYLQTAEELLGFSVDSVYRLFVAAVNLATAGIAYTSFRRSFQSSVVGVLASGIFTLSPYRLYLLYTRSAVGEYVALLFLPLILWGVYELCHSDGGEKRYLRKCLLLTVGFLGAICPYIVGRSIPGKSDDGVINEMPVAIDSTLLLCVLLWIGLQLKEKKNALSKEQKREWLVANLALLAGSALWVAGSVLTGVATLCILIAVGVMGKYLLREGLNALPGKAVLYALVVMALIFGTRQVNEVLMNSGNMMFF